MLYVAADSLNKNIIAILGLIILVIVVQFKHLLLEILFFFDPIIWARILLEIVETKRCPTDAPPRVMGSLPRLSTEKRSSAPDLRALVFDILSKISADKVILCSDIAFVKKEGSCPVRVLAV